MARLPSDSTLRGICGAYFLSSFFSGLIDGFRMLSMTPHFLKFGIGQGGILLLQASSVLLALVWAIVGLRLCYRHPSAVWQALICGWISLLIAIGVLLWNLRVAAVVPSAIGEPWASQLVREAIVGILTSAIVLFFLHRLHERGRRDAVVLSGGELTV